jgi:hypothetical protein
VLQATVGVDDANVLGGNLAGDLRVARPEPRWDPRDTLAAQGCLLGVTSMSLARIEIAKSREP